MNEFFENIMKQGPLVQGGLTLMLAGWMGYQLRALPARAWWLVRDWTTRVIQIRDTHPHYEAWLAMLTDHAVRRGGPRTMEVRVRFDDQGNRAHQPALAAGSCDFWARVNGKWCHVFVHREDGATSRSFAQRFIIDVEMVLGRQADVTRMVAEVARRANILEHRQLVDIYTKFGNTTTITIPKRDPATLCMEAGAFEAVESRLREFAGAREQYERAGIPWRFGMLISGEPGTGKTSLAHALASRLNLRLAVITLADLETDDELVTAFRSVRDPAMLLIEDVDCAFRQRETGETRGISFSGFLNCIDGVLAPHNGRVLVMSTNHPDRLDPALIRPGRVDLHIKAPLLTRQNASDYVDRVFPHVSTRHEIVSEVMACASPTPAMLINRITQQKWHKPGGAGPVAEAASGEELCTLAIDPAQREEDDDDEGEYE